MQFDPSRIVSLHNHGVFSVLDGLSKYEDIVKLAIERGQSAASITEHGNISGVAEFYHLCKDAGIKPIIGEEFYICPNGRRLTDRDPQFDRRRHHITIIAKNEAGYKNLCWLSSEAKINGDYYKPRIDYSTLFEHKEGLIVLSGCIVSQLNYFVESYLGNNGEKDPEGLNKARAYLKRMKEEFGDDFYVEQVWLRPTGKINAYDKRRAEESGIPYKSIIDRQNEANELTTKLAKELSIKRVMTADAHYARPEDKESHEILICIGTARNKSDEDRLTFVDQDLSIPSAEAMYNHAKELNDFELVETQGEIIDKVTLDLKLGEQGNRVPKFPIPEGIILDGKEIKTEAEYLRYLTFEGYKKKNYAEKWKDKLDIVHAEIKKELEVINNMGFNGYFLIVQEYCNWARANGVLVGPGRGSAAGSVVVYLIGITSVDPMEYPDLMIFERFLNPERYSMPDIDMDFSDRQKVEDHLVELYGRDHVCAIQTISRMRAKNAFKDVARTEGYNYVESNKVAALIPDLAGEAAKTNRLDKEVEKNSDLIKAIQADSTGELEKIFKEAIPLEGNVRGYGVHAAGVIISDEPLRNYIGLFTSNDGRIVQQSDSTQVEPDYGLLKMDLLGLANLSIMDDCIKMIKKNHPDFKYNSPDDFPTGDKETFEMISRGESRFTFQFNSALMRDSARRLKPKSLRDLALLVAVVRPGPLQYLEDIIAVKSGKKELSKSLDSKIDEIVESTYGHIVYQEQLMKVCTECCGFTMGEADKVRKAMGKSRPSELAKYRPDFIKGYLKHTNSSQEKEIAEFWDAILEFAKYCFNGSHSVCYATIGYQTAFLLTHYPEEYLAAYSNTKKDDKDALAEVAAFCKEKGIKFATPDILHPGMTFTPVPERHEIAYGLTAIKGVGGPAEEIIKFVEENHPTTLEEFLLGIERRKLNSRVIKALIFSGALDKFVPRELIDKEENFDTFSARIILAHNEERIIKFRDDYLKVEQKREKMKVDPKQASLLDLLFSADDLTESQQKKKNSLNYPSLDLEIPYEGVQLSAREKKLLKIKLLLKEKEMIGSCITKNPLLYVGKKEERENWYQDFLAKKALQQKARAEDKKLSLSKVLISGACGVLVKHRELLTKKNEPMAFMDFEMYAQGVETEEGDKVDKEVSLELTVFPEAYAKIRTKVKEKVIYTFDIIPEQEEAGSGVIRAIARSIEAIH